MKCTCHSHNGFLTSLGLEEAAQRSRQAPGVADMALSQYLDRPGSVSGLRRDEINMIFDEELLDEQHRRFTHSVEEAF